MLELQQLVKRYAAGEIDYPEFRQEFVPRFLAYRNAESKVDTAIAEIESACVDASIGEFASEAALRARLTEIANPQTVVLIGDPVVIGTATSPAFRDSGTSSMLQAGAAAAVSLGRWRILPSEVCV